jgi:hypothetical protein
MTFDGGLGVLSFHSRSINNHKLDAVNVMTITSQQRYDSMTYG